MAKPLLVALGLLVLERLSRPRENSRLVYIKQIADRILSDPEKDSIVWVFPEGASRAQSIWVTKSLGYRDFGRASQFEITASAPTTEQLRRVLHHEISHVLDYRGFEANFARQEAGRPVPEYSMHEMEMRAYADETALELWAILRARRSSLHHALTQACLGTAPSFEPADERAGHPLRKAFLKRVYAGYDSLRSYDRSRHPVQTVAEASLPGGKVISVGQRVLVMAGWPRFVANDATIQSIRTSGTAVAARVDVDEEPRWFDYIVESDNFQVRRKGGLGYGDESLRLDP